MLWAVGVLLALSAVGFVWRIASRHDRGAESPDPGVLEWRMPRAWPAFVVACGLVFLGFAVWAGLASPSPTGGRLGGSSASPRSPSSPPPTSPPGTSSWTRRASTRGGGSSARDVAWGDVDALSVVMAQRMMAGSVDSVAVMSGGRKAMRISGLVLGGPASQGRFLDEARRRGINPPKARGGPSEPWKTVMGGACFRRGWEA